jgi:outer membrane protein OmpA-like peptidoglycan-associated protein
MRHAAPPALHALPLVVATLALGLLAAPRSADAQAALPVAIEVSELVDLERAQPTFTVSVSADVRGLRLIAREGGRAVLTRPLGNVRGGATKVLPFRLTPGVHPLRVEVTGQTPEGRASLSFETTVTATRGLQIVLRKEDVDLEARTLRFTLTNPAGRAVVTITDAAGSLMHTATTDLHGAPPRSTLALGWPALPRGAGKITLRAFDTSDSWTEMEIVPFSVEIPHEDVVFETASDAVRPSEEPKLEAAYQRILAAVRQHGADLQAKLYVLGHTDTVGSPADNARLSERRALAIARWFRRRGGLTIPVLARGLGESSLAVSTPDNTDEARNRRAQYIVAAQSPVAGAYQNVP